MAFRYKIISVPATIQVEKGSGWNRWYANETNPEYQKFLDGVYIPPDGARIVGFDGSRIMLEYDLVEGHPYR